MKRWLAKLIANLGFAPHVAKPPELPPESRRLQADAKALLRDLREVRRLETIVRKR